MPLMLFFVVTAWCWNEPATSFIEINFDFHQVGWGSMPDYIRSRSTMQLRSMEYKFRQHLLHHNISFNASSMSELKMKLASGLFIRNKMAFLAIDEPFGICIIYKNDSFIVISLLRSPNESTHMMDKTWTGQLFAYRKNKHVYRCRHFRRHDSFNEKNSQWLLLRFWKAILVNIQIF